MYRHKLDTLKLLVVTRKSDVPLKTNSICGKSARIINS